MNPDDAMDTQKSLSSWSLWSIAINPQSNIWLFLTPMQCLFFGNDLRNGEISNFKTLWLQGDKIAKTFSKILTLGRTNEF